MKLIADSGSTKTKWALVDENKRVRSFQTKGLNPYFQTVEEAGQRIKNELLTELGTVAIDALHFYGAGCTPDKKPVVYKLFSDHFPITQTITVESDMMGAARSMCGNNPGIVCILGTGSNSCYYNGNEIVKNISPLGYILGDEGSGAVLGRTLIGDLLKNQLPDGLKEAFLHKYALTPADVIEKVYRQPFPNRFLASLSPFLLEHIDVAEVKELVIRCFKSFIERNVKQYDYLQHPVYFTGSIAWHYKEVLIEAAGQCGVTIESIEVDPVEGLVEYHC
ncbi:BadF/BadG/BcrA/BcrD ATPase family protein [Bacteroides sp. 519]|uniref:BadF/BadG/BcrA/BcrD ATPase family protein n=1 Tax=Bacteroides sp. 519 TaxID=2302937 RepID=UPI0013CF8E1B|nr:BadF/BadG/BcrA/BcrD ATPase family protein [Bacteroides sp. 519]NDV57382.1 ATPase [Bacteroides sp. 519]